MASYAVPAEPATYAGLGGSSGVPLTYQAPRKPDTLDKTVAFLKKRDGIDKASSPCRPSQFDPCLSRSHPSVATRGHASSPLECLASLLGDKAKGIKHSGASAGFEDNKVHNEASVGDLSERHRHRVCQEIETL